MAPKPPCALLEPGKDRVCPLEVAERNERLDLVGQETRGTRLDHPLPLNVLDERSQNLVRFPRFLKRQLQERQCGSARRTAVGTGCALERERLRRFGPRPLLRSEVRIDEGPCGEGVCLLRRLALLFGGGGGRVCPPFRRFPGAGGGFHC